MYRNVKGGGSTYATEKEQVLISEFKCFTGHTLW
jgi:hypothetical protein